MVMVVGDIINYSTISQVTDEGVIARSLHTLWYRTGRCSGLITAHSAITPAMRCSPVSKWVDFQTRLSWRSISRSPQIGLSRSWGLSYRCAARTASPIHMGWGVVQGMAALAAMTRSADAVIGDATNVAFRLAGLAGRHGRSAVMVTHEVHRSVAARFRWGVAENVEIKGRRGMETVFPVIARGT